MPSIAEWESVFQSSSKLIQVFKYINIILFSKSERVYKVAGEDISKLEENLSKLSKDLMVFEDSPAKFNIPPKDLKGKRDLLSTLTKQKNDLVKTLRQGGNRTDLLGSRTAGQDRMQVSDDMSNNDILSLQQMEMKKQDVVIDVLSDTVDNLHEIATTINDETQLQARLLDNLEDDVDVANKRLKMETEHTKKVTLSAKNASMYCCIALLIVILAILILVKIF